MIQSWSRAAVALAIVAASATGARLTPLVKTVEAGRCSGHTTLSPTLVATDAAPACRRSDVVKAVHGAGTDEAILARHRRLRIKRFRRRFGGLPSGAALRNEPVVAGIVGALEVATFDLPVPSRDYARAPPSSNHPA